MNWMQREQLPNGMWDTEWNVTTGLQFDGVFPFFIFMTASFTRILDHITIGALADSGVSFSIMRAKAEITDAYAVRIFAETVSHVG